MMKKIVVTRHPALVQYLREQKLIDETIVLTHVKDPKEIDGCHVFGVLPLNLAAHAAMVTSVPLALTAEDRGTELDIERVREIAGAAQTYVVYDEAKWNRLQEFYRQGGACSGENGFINQPRLSKESHNGAQGRGGQ